MQFSVLVESFQALEQTSSRNLMTELLVELFRRTPADEMCEVTYLTLGQLGPMFARIDFGLADKMAERAIARASGVEVAAVHATYKEMGDIGETAERLLQVKSRKSKVESDLEVHELYERLIEIATAGGAGSQEIKIEKLTQLLQNLTPTEVKYAVRIVMGKMRLGFSDKTILDVLSVIEGGSKAMRNDLDYIYQVAPDIGIIAEKLKTRDIKQLLAEVKPQIGVPVIPALAQRLKTPDEMVKKMGKVVVEPKYDGTRTQIHFDAHLGIRTFARSLEETTAMFPELTEAMNQIQADSIIIDSEAVGYDPQTGNLRPFQETITRKRKHGVAAASEQIPIRFFCFDVLYLNGESMIPLPLYERRRRLEQVLLPGKILAVDPLIVTESAAEVRAYHAAQLSGGLEGAMVKKYDGEYQPGRTGWNWVKFKEEETAEGKLSDTIDAVVLGYYRGKGKRSGFGLGAFLVGILKDSRYVTVAKIGTGLSDDQWRELKQRTDAHFAMEQPHGYEVAEGLKPDVWVEPSIVVEIAADEITKSPLHSSGYGLRFPRLVKFRDDKRADQATTAAEVEQIGNLKS